MMNRTAAVASLAAPLLLSGLTAGCASTTLPAPAPEPDYSVAYRAGNYERAATAAASAPSRDEQARLIEGMARAELGEADRAETLLRPLMRSPRPEVRGRAAATLGLIAQQRGQGAEAARLLEIAAETLSGSDGVWAARYALRAKQGSDAPGGSGAYKIQFGSFSTEARAMRHAQAMTRLTRSYGLAEPRIEEVQRGARTLYAVRTGPFSTRSAAAEAAATLNTDTAVVRIQ